jgi:hypothetical protein
MAYREKALALVLTPDCMVSDGSIERLQQLAHEGVQLVVAAALRFGQEPFFQNLKAQGVWAEADTRKPCRPLSISGRQMSYAAVNGFHPETLSYEWEAPYMADIIPAAWWRVPGEDGIVLHCLSWAPMLLDYAAVPDHDTSALEGWTIDGDYLFKNMGRSAKMHVVQDSDEIFLASWGPMSDGAHVFRKHPFLQGPIGRRVQRFVRGKQFRTSFYSSIFDPLKREIFFLPVRWHSRPLNVKWRTVERRTQRTLRNWIAPPGPGGVSIAPTNFQERLVMPVWGLIQYLLTLPLRRKWILLLMMRALHLVIRALRGDRAAARSLSWHVRRKISIAIGRSFDEPQPQLTSPSRLRKVVAW